MLTHRPDVLTIDYCLNDRGIGLERARAAWTSMIRQAQRCGVRVILLTPTPDLRAGMGDLEDDLHRHAAQARRPAAEHGTARFQRAVADGTPLESLMSHCNHPNAAGHRLVADALLDWFPAEPDRTP